MSGIEASCIFCDDVRREIGGKFSFIGSYANDIIIHAKDINYHEDAVPGLPEFFVVCFLKNLDRRKRYSILIEQTGVDDKKYDVDLKDQNSERKLILIFNMINFVIPEAGAIKVHLVSGKEKKIIDELKIVINQEKS